MYFSFIKPSKETIQNLLNESSKGEVTYPEKGATFSLLPEGYHHVHASEIVGEGLDLFERIQRELLNLVMFDVPGITTGSLSELHVGDPIAITFSKSFYHLKFLILSEALITSVSRTPNFSLATTTSPCAIRVPLIIISSGSPASLSNSTTEPWLS